MNNPIEEAIAALRHGDQPTAFTLLRARLAEEPKDALAWLWMSEATADVRRKVEALTRFLQLAPNHPHVPSVRLRLQQLQGQLAGLPSDSHPLPATLSYTDDPPMDSSPPPVITPPPIKAEPRPSLLGRINTAPQPVIQVDEPSETSEESDAPGVRDILSPMITPRPAAPPPPNFQPMRSGADEDDGLPLWVWGLMVLAFILVGLFLYVILNFERFASLFG